MQKNIIITLLFAENSDIDSGKFFCLYVCLRQDVQNQVKKPGFNPATFKFTATTPAL
jgi:hypothetical protein